MRINGPFRDRRNPSLRKGFYVVDVRGQLFARKWPVSRGKPTHPTTLKQNDDFLQANQLTKYVPARIQSMFRDMTKGTGLYPRDLMVAAIYGRGFTTHIPGQTVRYPVAAVKDLSLTLDLLGGVAGDIIARGNEVWQGVTPTAPGQSLISQNAGEPPIYQGIGSQDGLWTQIEDFQIPTTLAIGAFHDVVIPTGWKELDCTLFTNFAGVANRILFRLNGDAATKYLFTQLGMKIDLSTTTVYRFTQSQIYLQSWFNALNTAPKRVSIRMNSNPAFNRVLGHCEYTDATLEQNNVSFRYDPGGVEINKISFASDVGEGLPAQTRIIVRAQM